MYWIDLIVVLASLQFILFGILVARARGKYSVHAPATTGHEMFERYYRVHMNTLEMLVLFFPAVWTAAKYWRAEWVALAGAVYLAGRFVYLRAYVKDPKTRELGFVLSILPIFGMLIASLAGLVMAYLKSPV